MQTRKVVKIDESKCDGCGLCVPSCAEGAIQIIDGKARLVSDVYCDGLGACLGHCPQDAIAIEEREAVDFDESAAHEHVRRLQAQNKGVAAPATPGAPAALHGQGSPHAHGHAHGHHGGCPGAMARMLQPKLNAENGGAANTSQSNGMNNENTESQPSALGNWPVQLSLVPPQAPYFQGADILLVADCVPFAFPDFHRRFLRGKPVVIGCPKLDDSMAHAEKMAAILEQSDARSLTVIHMQVPCCSGLVRIAQYALDRSGKALPFTDITIGIGGEILSEVSRQPS